MNMNEINCFSSDIQKLKEIFENIDVHPKIMLNKAIERAKEIKSEDFDEELFTSIKDAR